MRVEEADISMFAGLFGFADPYCVVRYAPGGQGAWPWTVCRPPMSVALWCRMRCPDAKGSF